VALVGESDLGRSLCQRHATLDRVSGELEAAQRSVAVGARPQRSPEVARQREPVSSADSLAAALRSRAQLLLVRGETVAAVGAAVQAADAFDSAGFPFDRGRSLLVAGDALRCLGERRRAAEKLEAARAVFVKLGAALWVERAEQELRRARPRPRRDRELTSAERRVATHVAAGKTNREVAAQLFTTVATVEAHLTRIYRKLGVRSRTELARGVADGTLTLAE
jgi:DNA-binding CsgD family transcriptional regulator